MFMDCELCGREAEGGLYLISIEGARMSVCKKCTSHGKVLEFPKPAFVPRKINMPAPSEAEEVELELAENYSRLIKGARERMGLSQEDFAMKINETANVIKKVELGKMAPMDSLAHRIEKFTGIKLFVKPEKE